MSAGLCRHCGGLMLADFYGDGLHPSCDPESRRLIRNADIARRKGIALAQEGKRRALKNNPKAAQIGVDIIRKYARKQRILGPGDVRADFEAADINIKSQAGGIWSSAKAQGIVKEVDRKASDGESAHGKEIGVYLSLIFKPDSAVG